MARAAWGTYRGHARDASCGAAEPQKQQCTSWLVCPHVRVLPPPLLKSLPETTPPCCPQDVIGLYLQLQEMENKVEERELGGWALCDVGIGGMHGTGVARMRRLCQCSVCTCLLLQAWCGAARGSSSNVATRAGSIADAPHLTHSTPHPHFCRASGAAFAAVAAGHSTRSSRA